MKKILLSIITIALAVSCSQQENYPPVEHSEIIGNTYSNSLYDIEITSKDSLKWSVWTYRDTTMTYSLEYSYTDYRITFEINDSISTPYTDNYSGTKGYIIEYNSDTFSGSFRGTEILVGDTIVHSYAKYLDGDKLMGNGVTSTQDVHLYKK